MNQYLIIYIITIHLLCLLLGWGIVKVFPKIWGVTLDKKSIVLAGSLGILIAWIVTLAIDFKRFDPPKELSNTYYEGKIYYKSSNKTLRGVGTVFIIHDDNNGNLHTVRCSMPTKSWLEKGAIPCGYDEIASKTFYGQKGKVWFYNDAGGGSLHTRLIATQIILDNGTKFPYSIQYQSIIASMEKAHFYPFSRFNIVRAVGAIFLFTFIFLLVIGIRIKNNKTGENL